jgi:hypothetical protein
MADNPATPTTKNHFDILPNIFNSLCRENNELAQIDSITKLKTHRLLEQQTCRIFRSIFPLLYARSTLPSESSWIHRFAAGESTANEAKKWESTME